METPTLPAQAANQVNIYENIFNRQKAYFATNITKSFEWRLEQLGRLAQLLSEHTDEFYDALSRDRRIKPTDWPCRRWSRSWQPGRAPDATADWVVGSTLHASIRCAPTPTRPSKC